MKNKIDVKKLSINELEELLLSVSEEIEKRKKNEAELVRQKIDLLLKESGLSLEEVFEAQIPVAKTKVPAKYRHPTDASLVWTGRGKMPLWMQELIKNGAAKEDFLIK